MKAIILAGGQGTRLKPLTDNIPKALIPIGDSTLIELILTSLPSIIDTVIITTKYLPEKIKQHIGTKHHGKTILYAAQPEDSKGTWAALYCTREYIDTAEQFLVLNCDDLFEQEELERVVATHTIGMGVTHRTMPAKYHGISISSEGFVQGLQRHPNPDREELLEDTFANGLYLLDARVFGFPAVLQIDNEEGLPQTLLKQINEYPLKAHYIEHWNPCNSFEDLARITK